MKPEILQELERIRQRNEHHLLMPAEVVHFARDEQTSLHSQFEWDDSLAADRWRVEQARGVIRVAITIIGKGENQVSVPLYISLSSDRDAGGGYRAMHEILDDETLQQQMLADALRELQTFQQKYQRLQTLNPIWTAMEEVIKQKPTKQRAKHREASATV
jgi:hypothetical protein